MSGTGITAGRVLAGTPVTMDDGTTAYQVQTAGGVGSSPAATAVVSNVTSAAADTLLLAANPLRLGFVIANDSASVLYVLLGSGAASPTNYTYQIDAKTTVPGVASLLPNWAGQIRGYWSAANGAALVTEVTA